jgi:hypothetical protein
MQVKVVDRSVDPTQRPLAAMLVLDKGGSDFLAGNVAKTRPMLAIQAWVSTAAESRIDGAQLLRVGSTERSTTLSSK